MRNVVEPTFVIALTLVIFSGNIVNLLVIRRCRDIPPVPRYFMSSLAVADLGIGFISIFAVYPSLTGVWPYGDIVCFIIGVHSHTFCSISIVSLLFVSIERYSSINWPLRYHRYITDRRAIVLIITKWVVLETYGFLLAVIQDWNFYHFNRGALTCVPGYGEPAYRNFTIVGLVTFIIIPTIIIAYIYIHIMQIVRRHKNQIMDLNTPKNSEQVEVRKTNNQNFKAAKMLFAVSGAFDIAWYPYGISTLYHALSGKPLPEYVHFITIWLVYSNSFWNVLIYTVMNKKFRNAAMQLLRQCVRCGTGVSQNDFGEQTDRGSVC